MQTTVTGSAHLDAPAISIEESFIDSRNALRVRLEQLRAEVARIEALLREPGLLTAPAEPPKNVDLPTSAKSREVKVPAEKKPAKKKSAPKATAESRRASDLLRAAMKERGLTYGALASEAGVGRSTVFTWLAGERKPSKEQAATIEALTGVPAKVWA